MNSKDMTVTAGRFIDAIDNTFNQVVGPKITQQIINAVENERIKTGVMTKFYQYLDRVEVKIDGSEDTVLCRILHRFGGELIDFYTPTGEDSFCDILKEPCVIPRGELHCCILNINDDTDEWLMLGYFNAEELIGVNPAAQGNIKIVTRGGTNQFWVKFGYDGLDIRSLTPASVNVGETDEKMTPLEYANTNDVYNKEEITNIIDEVNGRILSEEELRALMEAVIGDEVDLSSYATLEYVGTELAKKVNVLDIQDNLTSNDTDKPLSAKQGKVLNDLIGDAISYINQ